MFIPRPMPVKVGAEFADKENVKKLFSFPLVVLLLSFLLSHRAMAQASGVCVSCDESPSQLKRQTEAFQEISQKSEMGSITSQKAGCTSPDNIKKLLPIALQPTENLSESVTWKAFGEEFDSFYGIPAYSNQSTGGGKYQCTELVHRFMSGVFGVPTALGMGIGDGDVVAQNMTARFKNEILQNANTANKKARLAYIQNRCSSQPPVVGSLISIKYSNAGHVAIIRDVKKVGDQLELTLFEQHGIRRLAPGAEKVRTKIRLSKNADGTWSGDKVVGWIVVSEIQ